ncbi:MAG: heat-inducible transcriptional repressor HrcA [Oscillospiraceae bacterium]|jgi:heat-inducible transcriptional repressor|nr:heat-inducible transcriptional repressor HrcA [Oscillospiraceae bacterium]
MDLDERKYRILQAIIDDYILTASPVGSRTISRKYEQSLSSATIRNEMSDLEELGYLDSPHTSAGRIPSHKAYRLYVDRLMRRVPLAPADIEQLRAHFDRRMRQANNVAQLAARALSDATHYTSVVVTRPAQEADIRVRHLQLVEVSAGTALLLLVTDTGAVKEALLYVDRDLSRDDLYQISRILSARLENCRLEDVPRVLGRLISEWHEGQDVLNSVLEGVRTHIVKEPTTEMVVSGSANLLSFPEYSDVEKARDLLLVLETKDKVMRLLENGGGMAFTIRIGPETGMQETKDCSVVTATYHMGSDTLGTVGIIGPTRMQYQQVVAVLDYVGRTLVQIMQPSE